MPTELLDLIADLEVAMIDTVNRIDEAEMRLVYVAVLDLEQRLAGLQDAIALTAESIASRPPE